MIFRSAQMRTLDTRIAESGGLARIAMAAAYDHDVRDEMGWPELPAGAGEMELEDVLVLDSFSLVPNGELKNFTVDGYAREARDFRAVKINVPKSESQETVLRFVVVTADAGSAQRLHVAFWAIGRAPCQLKVSYQKQTEVEQQALPGATEEQPEKSGRRKAATVEA
jgi:hypothetical protein